MIPRIHIHAESWCLFDCAPTFSVDFDLSTLVSTRRAHKTQRAFNSVRTQFRYDTTDVPLQAEREGDIPIHK